MAYMITLFVRSGEPVAQRAIHRLAQEVTRRDPAVTTTAAGDGVGWAAYELSAERDLREQVSNLELDLLPPDPKSWPVLLQANTGPQAVKAQIEWGLTQGGPQVLTSCDAFVELSLSGHLIDWKLVRSICEVTTEMWDAVLHDEGSGFDVTLDDLP
ncbi:hypothetical protein NCC78_04210 [Micromonospora phytophila]|uniref:hypothetical protein n=1 Tax=Micromonospora phytophila TaxID=709888 RepID=UPI002030ABFC|nr:hypothetical protein [Micromonospora phytophila]MCM0673912.1 hypothetical protein [Micromonospora phytophila]